MLPEINFEISVLGIFVIISIIFMVFVLWIEGSNKDGFDSEKLFDLLIISSLFAFVFSRIFYAIFGGFPFTEIFKFIYEFWREGHNIYGVVVGFLLSLYLFSKRWSWSIFRILDVFSLAISFGISIFVLSFVATQQKFEYLFAFAAWLGLYILLSKLRNRAIKSGQTFSAFLALNSVLGLIFFNDVFYLPLYVIFITLSMLVLIFREKRDASMNFKTFFTQDFLNNIKQKLNQKNSDLKKQEQTLIEEDPYSAEGRADDNSEIIDEVQEDVDKANQVANLTFVQNARVQVRRALAKMKLGKYGYCEVCNEPIDKARLEIYPEANTCIEHAEK